MKPLWGAFPRTLDARCRIRLPGRFREALGTVRLAIVARRDCLEAVVESEVETFRRWRAESDAKDHETTRSGHRAGKAERSAEGFPVLGLLRADREGRIRLPKPSAALLREHGSKILLFGRPTGFEIWDRARFEEHVRHASAWSDEDEEPLRNLEL